MRMRPWPTPCSMDQKRVTSDAFTKSSDSYVRCEIRTMALQSKVTNLQKDDAQDRIVLPHPRVLDGNSNMGLAPVPDEPLRPSVEDRRASDRLDPCLIHKLVIK